jgi:hypothetical protein
MADETHSSEREAYEAPALRELGAIEEITSGEDESILDTTTTV